MFKYLFEVAVLFVFACIVGALILFVTLQTALYRPELLIWLLLSMFVAVAILVLYQSI